MLRRLFTHQRQSGATLVEVLVAIALTSVMLPTVATALVTSHAGKADSIQELQATSLLREATEAVRVVRESGWSHVSTDGTYHPVISGSTWSLASGSEVINGFTRQIVISDTQRNTSLSNWPIVSSGGTTDPSTKHVVVTVSWTTPVAASLSSETYLSRWQTNATWTQTTQADFAGGTTTATDTCTDGTCDNLSAPNNSVQLVDSPAHWQLPSVYGSGYNISGNVAGNDVFVATIGGTPYAFVGYATGLAIINISNPTAPTLAGNYTTSAAVNGVFVSGNYAYLATAISTAQLTIVNVSNPAAPTLTSSLRIQDTNNVAATAVYVSGTTAVVVKKKVGKAFLFNTYGEINTVNVSNPASPSLSNSLNVGADCSNVWVNGSYAYVVDSVSNQQLNIVNISNPSNISSSATVNLGANANSVLVNGSTLYVALASNSSTELRVYHLNSATSLTAQGSYEVGGNATGLGLDASNPDYLAVTSDAAGKQLMILNVSNPSSPNLVNNISLGGTGNSVQIYGSFAYVGTADTSKELTVVYSGYRPSGTFESSTFDAGANVGLNYFTFTNSVPSGSSLKYQVAANNSGSGWSYEGPDGTSGTYYTAPGAIPLNIASNRYFRYKAYFTPTADGQQTPALNDITLNYSP